MISQRYRCIATMLLLQASALLTAVSYGLEVLTDEVMSTQTGQQGVTIGITPAVGTVAGKLGFNYVLFEDEDGLAGVAGINGVTATSGTTQAFSSKGSTFFNFMPASRVGLTDTAIGFYRKNGDGTYTLSTQDIKINIDADGNGVGKAAAVINIEAQSDLARIYFNIADIKNVTTGTNEKGVIAFRNGVIVDFVSPFKMTMLLGGPIATQPMLTLTSLNIELLDLGLVEVVNQTSFPDKVRLGARVENANLSGMVLNVGKAGLVLSKAGDVSIGKIVVGRYDSPSLTGGANPNSIVTAAKTPFAETDSCTYGTLEVCGIVAGQLGSTSSSFFNSIANGSMGNVVIENVVIKNPTVTVKGL